jgi:hypothetical protein
MRKQDESRVFWPGRVDLANLEVISAVTGTTLTGTKYLCRYDCCGREGTLRHDGLLMRISRNVAAREAGNPDLVCARCNREKQGSANRERQQQRRRKPDYFPMQDANLGSISGPPVWPRPTV